MVQDRPIRILSVEDHPVFRQGLAAIVSAERDMLLVGQASNAVDAVAEFRRHRPDITLMDLRLPGTNGTDALIAIRGEFPQAHIIILTTSDGDGDIQRACRHCSRLDDRRGHNWRRTRHRATPVCFHGLDRRAPRPAGVAVPHARLAKEPRCLKYVRTVRNLADRSQVDCGINVPARSGRCWGIFRRRSFCDGHHQTSEFLRMAAGYVRGVVTTADGKYIVPLMPSGRLQIYDSQWHFIRGRNVGTSGGNFKVQCSANGVIEVFTATGEHHYSFAQDVHLIGSESLPEPFSLLPDEGQSVVVPTSPLLWIFSSPFLSWGVA